ncbi:MAG TPA: thiamine pyrophosphate-dependent enzyme [Bdellovibrionota bacterium]|nr:thiamine pyrophosphate-dependent enzyme [Bdellovibrionota bacterium]
MNLYLDSTKPFPHCPGCGHPHVLRALDQALRMLDVPQERVALVTDIGCVGLADALFPAVHTIHTLHGRSVAVAAGISMGERSEEKPGLSPIVLIGDGGAGIGLLHLIHAAQLNARVAVLVHNNLIYGMTGGQHSVLTPFGLKTTTTPNGSPIPALDLGALLMSAGAGFFARTVAPGDDVAVTIQKAIEHPGFACVEILELCPTFATARGGIGGRELRALPERQGMRLGILRQETRRPALAGPKSAVSNVSPEESGVPVTKSWRFLDRPVQVLLAGRAGERIQSAALFCARAAAASGLEMTLRTDNPVTQGSGFSLAEVTFSPEPIGYTGLGAPEIVFVLAEEGQKELQGKGAFKLPEPGCRYLFDGELLPPAGVPAVRTDFRAKFGPKNAALAAAVSEIHSKRWWDGHAWWAALKTLPLNQQGEVRELLAKILPEGSG